MTKKSPLTLWRTLQEQQIQDDVDEILAMSDAELDAYVRSNGGDPAAIRARGATLAKELGDRRAKLAWHADMHEKSDTFRATAAARRSTVKLPRAELLTRLSAARTDPRFAAPVAALFQKKTAEASTDDELQALLDQIDLLRELESD